MAISNLRDEENIQRQRRQQAVVDAGNEIETDADPDAFFFIKLACCSKEHENLVVYGTEFLDKKKSLKNMQNIFRKLRHKGTPVSYKRINIILPEFKFKTICRNYLA